MALAYGKNPKSYEDPEILAVNRCLARLGKTLRPGVWKVDVFPFLRFGSTYYLPNVASHLLRRYIPGYLTELHDGHAEELTLFKQQLHGIRLSIVCLILAFILPYVKELISDGDIKGKGPRNSPVIWKIPS